MSALSMMTPQMVAVFALIVVALALYVTERVPMEITSLGVICGLLLLFQIMPLEAAPGVSPVTPGRLLSGFANPALLTVLGLLVVGEGLARTGILTQGGLLIMRATRGSAWLSVVFVLFAVMVISAFLNNIPVVVLAIPIMQALSVQLRHAPSRHMMSLSFASILGGMTTLIGSSTNILVSGTLYDLGLEPFGFFDFTIPGMVLAAAGMAYLVLVAPRLLPDRAPTHDAVTLGGKQFIAQITVTPDSGLDGLTSVGGFFRELSNMTVQMVQRREQAFLPPFDDLTLQAGDVMVVAATRQALVEFSEAEPGVLFPDLREDMPPGRVGGEGRWSHGEQALAEVMVPPGSYMIGKTLENIGFRYKHHCIVLGIERRAKMLRERMTRVPLDAGDVLLIQGRRPDINRLRGLRSVILLEWSATELPASHHALGAAAILFVVIAMAASGLVPVVVAALCGAVAVVATGILTMESALRALDPKIVLTIAMALSLGIAMQATGGADFLAHLMLVALLGAAPAVVLSAFFLLVAGLSNVLSTKATAVLFTPIAAGVALELGVPVEPFAVAVVFAANCSFASPIGYQTNLLVMTPGNYRFTDFIRTGLPLILVVWAAFSLFAPAYYGL